MTVFLDDDAAPTEDGAQVDNQSFNVICSHNVYRELDTVRVPRSSICLVQKHYKHLLVDHNTLLVLQI